MTKEQKRQKRKAEKDAENVKRLEAYMKAKGITNFNEMPF